MCVFFFPQAAALTRVGRSEQFNCSNLKFLDDLESISKKDASIGRNFFSF